MHGSPHSLSNQNGINGTPVQLIDERQTSQAGVGGMEAGVANNGLAAMLDYTTRPADFLSRAEHGDAERRSVPFRVGDDLHGCRRCPSPTMVRHGVCGMC